MAGASPSPSLRTVAERASEAPAAGRLLVTDGAATTRSGSPCGGRGASDTVTCTAVEQLLAVSDSPVTASAHAPYQYVPLESGAASPIDAGALAPAASAETAWAVPTSVSSAAIVESDERYQRSVVAAASPAPRLRTVADRVNGAPGPTAPWFTPGDSTTRSGPSSGSGRGVGANGDALSPQPET